MFPSLLGTRLAFGDAPLGSRPELLIALAVVSCAALLTLAWVMTLRAKLRQSTETIRAHFEKEKRLEAQLRQAQKLEALGRLAGGVAHDFNNLLTIINSCSEMLATRLPERSPEQALAADIYRAGQKAASLTNQLLLFSKHRAVPLGPVNLSAVVQDAAKLLRRIMPEHIEIELNLAERLPKIDAENGLIHQILINLAVNSRDAMPHRGRLTISTLLTNDGKIRLSVGDTGHGMDDATQTRLFEPFFTTKDVGKGTGLGLATVYGIIQTLKGEIHCRSKLGVGTTFFMDFPVGATRAIATAPALPPPEPKASAPTSKSAAIFLVEDDSLVRNLIESVLKLAGYQVVVAGSPKAALAVADKHPGQVDLLLTDVVMPEMNGRQLAEFLQVKWPKLKVLYMSGYTPDDVLEQGVDESVASFLQKPFTPMTLRAKVEEMLAKKTPPLTMSGSNTGAVVV
jgi:signal transduction histidine kinase/CheY-like chemotaxis protein